jgi:hypothetical protein
MLVPEHPAAVVAVHAPLVEQHAPISVEAWQKVVGEQAVPDTPTPAPCHTALPVQPAELVAVQDPVAEQQAPSWLLQKLALQVVPEV